ncbi:MAG TPA: hypothetical protein VG651_20280 [Stellaceae bacterium]|nr:hypothetical protein [Stellaceae bacterium]
MPPLAAILRRYASDSEAAWSCGSFGAVAEFMRGADEPADIIAEDVITVATARGALRIAPSADIRPIAYELPRQHPDTWHHGLALCLPLDECRPGGRSSLTELGPDTAAVRPQDRTAIRFDLGLGIAHADICVRTTDPDAVALLRRNLGASLLPPDGLPLLREIAAFSPHRVFACRFGRVEVFQPIPRPGGKTPDGPHTHILPKLLGSRRTHAATLPIPAGLVPCMTLFPPSPIAAGHDGITGFDEKRHEAFQLLWARYGIPELVQQKAAAADALRAGTRLPDDLPPPLDRAGRAVVEVARRQWRQTRGA